LKFKDLVSHTGTVLLLSFLSDYTALKMVHQQMFGDNWSWHSVRLGGRERDGCCGYQPEQVWCSHSWVHITLVFSESTL